MQEFEQNHQQRVEVLRGHTSGNVPHETVHEGSEGRAIRARAVVIRVEAPATAPASTTEKGIAAASRAVRHVVDGVDSRNTF